MALWSFDRRLLEAVGGNVRDALAGKPLKVIQKETGVSEPTAVKLRQGDLPVFLAPFFATLKGMGTAAALKVLEPVLGPMDDRSLALRLDALLREVGDIRHAVTPAALEHSHRLLGSARSGGEGAGGGAGGAGGPVLARMALTTVRQPLDAGASDAALRAPLTAFSDDLTLSECVARARALGNVSLAFRPRRDTWRLLYPSRLNRLVPRTMTGRPFAEHPDRAFSREVEAHMDEAAASPDPLVYDVIGEISQPRPIATRYRTLRLAFSAVTGERVVAAPAVRYDLAAAA